MPPAAAALRLAGAHHCPSLLLLPSPFFSSAPSPLLVAPPPSPPCPSPAAPAAGSAAAVSTSSTLIERRCLPPPPPLAQPRVPRRPALAALPRRLRSAAVSTATTAGPASHPELPLQLQATGASEENIRGLFQKAYRTAPSVVFIDEIDAIASKRENMQREMERWIVTQLMTCMDEFH